MEFFDMNLAKWLQSFAPCYSQSFLLADFKDNPVLLSVIKNPSNPKIRKTRKLESFHEKIAFCRMENMRVEN
jgi:hypothetical protein